MTNSELANALKVMLGYLEAEALYIGSNLLWSAAPPYDAEIEYLLNTGVLYLDTGIICDEQCSIELSVVADSISDEVNYICGASSSWNNNFNFSIRGNADNQIGGWFGNENGSVNDPTATVGTLYILSASQNGIYINGADITNLRTGNDFLNLSILLFTKHNGDGQINSHYFTGKIYWFKITKNNTLIMDLIPVRIGQTGYMYDKISRRLFGNSGSGSFVLGPDKNMMPYDAEIEYLESSGTLYINTGIIPDEDTGIYVKNSLGSGADNYVVGLRNDASSDSRWVIARTTQNGWYWGYGQCSGSYSEYLPYTNSNTVAECKLNYLNSKKWQAEGENNSREVLLPSLLFIPLYNIRIFGSAGVSSNYTTYSGKIYSVKISLGSNIIMDLIPVRIGLTGYMYDKVNKQLFSNGGTGNFVLGPDKYDAEIEYLESDGYQYIDTGIFINSSNFEIGYTAEGFCPWGWVHLMNGNGTWITAENQLDSGNFRWWYGNFNRSDVAGYLSGFYTIKYNFEEGVTINGVSRSFTGDMGTDGISTVSLKFFTRYDFNAHSVESGQDLACKFKSFYVKVDGVLVRDFIPVRVGEVGYMYDRISKLLFSNSGTGSFTLDSDKKVFYDSEIEYLESTGTQWIDTGITPNSNTKVQFKFMNLAATGNVIIGYYTGSDSSDWRFFNYLNTAYFDVPILLGSTGVRISGGNINPNTVYEIELGNFYVKDLNSNLNIVSGSNQTFTGYSTITLNSYEDNNNSSNRWYYVKIYDGDTLVRDMIPVRIGLIGYMYDKISRNLLGNSGSGNFILGSDLT